MAIITQPPAGTPVVQQDSRYFDSIWTGWFRDLATIQSTNASTVSGLSTSVATLNTSMTSVQNRVTTIETYKAILQRVTTQTGAVATGTTIIPRDDTIPQITEGDQYMTLSITPKSATSILVIDSMLFLSSSAANIALTVALFQDATVDALAATNNFQATLGGNSNVLLRYTKTSGNTSATTFQIRAGGNGANTITFNGAAGGRYYGGVAASSITITEYQP